MEKMGEQDGFQIGDWVISADADGNLNFTNKGSTGHLMINGSQAVTAGNVIYLSNSYGFLNGTTKQGGPGAGWNAVAYWQDDNPPDGDSNLNITIVS